MDEAMHSIAFESALDMHEATACDRDAFFTYDVSKTPWIAQTSKRIPDVLKGYLVASGLPEHLIADKDIPYLLGAIWDGNLVEGQPKNMAFAATQVHGVREVVADNAAMHSCDEEEKRKQAIWAEEAAAKAAKEAEEAEKDRRLWISLNAGIEEESLAERLIKALAKLWHASEEHAEALENVSNAIRNQKDALTLRLDNAQNDALQFLRTEIGQYIHSGIVPATHPEGSNIALLHTPTHRHDAPVLGKSNHSGN